MLTNVLFTPIRLGVIELPHRIIMAPLTRMRADSNGVPGAMNAEYYAQRASAALNITEATAISIEGRGIPHMPEIHSEAQIAGWRNVVDAVHAQGGRIVLQIVHHGRASHVAYMPDRALPVAPSAIAIAGTVYMPDFTLAEYQTPRALTIEEIPAIVDAFRLAALNAREAGFDGVELHAANGYLLNQFLEDGSNRRTDSYGGSYRNRSRLLLEVVEAVKNAIGAERLGVRLSPFGTAGGMNDSNPKGLYSYVVSELNKRQLAYLHLIESRASGLGRTDVLKTDAPNNAELFEHLFDGPVISAGGYTPKLARVAIEGGRAAAIAFGRLFISNPDLVSRIRRRAALNAYDRKTFYGGGAHGYTDYPELDSTAAAGQQTSAAVFTNKITKSTSHLPKDTLFTPLLLGTMSLPNRIIMAPLTRMRSGAAHVPTALNAQYYAQRSSAGLIISEGTAISPQAHGYPDAPGIYTVDQIAGWRTITEGVHALGGRIFMQVAHSGRNSHSSLLPDRALPVAPSAIPPNIPALTAAFQQVPAEIPRALETYEIPVIVDTFRRAALNAMTAGFDGVELQGANGHLIEQFLQNGTNQRTDTYGGSKENRGRFLLDIVQAVRGAIGGERVGVRLSPFGQYGGIHDSNPTELFTFVIEALNRAGIAYVHLIEARGSEIGLTDELHKDAVNNAALFRPVFDGPLLSAAAYTPESAAEAITKKHADAIAFGRSFIANPDLVERIKQDKPLNAADRSTFYGGDAHGYTDYRPLGAAA